MNVTPAMQQFYDIKKEYSDAILFFRMWDFYEMFEEDAQIAHKVLWISLTSRNKNAENPILLAWIPFHAKDKYLPMLIQAGYKVAIAEQVSDPKLKWIVKREVVRVVTPATLNLEDESFDNIWHSPVIISLSFEKDTYWFSVIDLGSHSWICSEFTDFSRCAWEIYKLAPSEVILEKSLYGNEEIKNILSKKYSLNIYYYELQEKPTPYLLKKLWVKNLEWYGIQKKLWAQKASAQIIKYLEENQWHSIDFLQNLKYESFSEYMDLDESTIRSLDIVYNIATQSHREGTLLWVLDQTQSSMWKRYLREQLLHPLQDIWEIKKRQDFIAAFVSDTILLDKIRKELSYVADIDAILSRLSLQRALPKDLLSLKRSLIAVREILNIIESSEYKILKKLL